MSDVIVNEKKRVSFSQFSWWLKCPHKWYLDYVKGLKQFEDTINTCFGTAIHETIQTYEIELPCLITVGVEIGQPRLPSFRLKMKTKDKNIDTFTLNDFSDKNEDNYGLNGSPTQVIKIFPPAVRSERETWEGDAEANADRLVSKLIEFKLI